MFLATEQIEMLREAEKPGGLTIDFCPAREIANLQTMGLVWRHGMAPSWTLTRKGRDALSWNVT